MHTPLYSQLYIYIYVLQYSIYLWKINGPAFLSNAFFSTILNKTHTYTHVEINIEFLLHPYLAKKIKRSRHVYNGRDKI